MYKKVLLPISGERQCERARIALKKALKICDGMFVLLHVADPIPQTVGGDARRELIEEDNAKGNQLMAPIIEQLEHGERRFQAMVERGTVAETIVRVADEQKVDLIVMFTDGREDFSDLLLGTITERVLRNCGVDLLAVRREDQESVQDK